ncbi:unnamed protein product [Phytomonas sp. Hart1]|nr:unnamed protein product [Phytomonas sp. Hart1]|eukprot:CCW69049.1 unnamed protein product [Phytomonas sp. isolate Hart1]
MRVKSIVIDGFKSYAHRKELADLSPHFNAITGLNGSGKSNIFDAICFVMGITNLKRVRAEDPRELIFRAGTTGVHAARVTIEFINDDPATAPPGYSCEDYPIITVGRQIKIGGKQQFFLNNAVSMQSKVKRFFESNSLNVDNPHFMVLQGTVHKLIDMRSQVLLSLIEEAVGTKAFDHRRRVAETLIRNKEKKMLEIDQNMETQIGPMLADMKADQEEYHRFLKASANLDVKRRFQLAFEFYERSNLLQEKQESMDRRKEDATHAKGQLEVIPQQEDELTRQLMRLQESIVSPSDAMVTLHEKEGELKKLCSRCQSQIDSCAKTLKHLESQLKGLHQEREKQTKAQLGFMNRRKQHETLLQSIAQERGKVDKLRSALQLAQSGVRAGTSGLSLAEELSEVENQIIRLDSKIQRSKENIVQLTLQLKNAQQRHSQQSGQLLQLKKEMERAQAKFEATSKLYDPLALQEKRLATLKDTISKAKIEFQEAYDSFQREAATSRSFELEFDRRGCPKDVEDKILGRVGELIYPKEDTHKMALMVGAQAQLLRVVVEDDTVAEYVIKHGLRQRTSFLALNQLQKPPGIDPARLETARRITASMNGFMCIASELVEYADPKRMAGLSESTFGNFLVCSTLSLAQELAYNPAVRFKAVSLDGEVAEPNGLITGGSTSHLRDVFTELKTYRERKAPLQAMRIRLIEMEREYHTIRSELERKKHVLNDHRNAEGELEVIKQRLHLVQGSSKSSIDEAEAQLRSGQNALESAEYERRELVERKQQIEKEAAIDPDHSRKELQNQMDTAERTLARLSKEEEVNAGSFERLEADIEQQATDLTTKTREVEDELSQQQRDRVVLQTQLKQAEEELEMVQKECKRSEAHHMQVEREIEEAQAAITGLTERRHSLENTVKNTEIELKELHKIIEGLHRWVREQEKRHNWITQERHQFGDPSGPFFFADTARTQTTLQELRDAEAQAAVMSRRTNKKATILYEERKKEYDELAKQREALGEDKEAIQQCIRGIEVRKWQALDRMVGVVSSIFGKLFSTCLPGATAELVEERDDYHHLSGLAVRVFFNGKVKTSLSELSGGQRSLLALCLILAILRVRPAPIYILDEVDAALDPSHTQNIGRMLQLYFPNSQFLLVSLKDGMFNNANVLYHVRNTQGYSEISRVVNSTKSSIDNTDPTDKQRHISDIS